MLYHITIKTHNSRISERMILYKVKKGDVITLDASMEIAVTECIGLAVKKYCFTIHEYAICCDHVHMLIECPPELLSDTLKTIKSVSTKAFKEKFSIQPEEKFHLWAQKFNRKMIHTETQRKAVQHYIRNNRKKHGLGPNEPAQNAAIQFLTRG